MAENIENISEFAEKLGVRQLQVLAMALKTAQERVVQDPSAGNISALTSAKRALDDLMAPSGPAEKIYRNVQEVWRELKKRGYGLKKSKIHADARRGLLRRQADKSVTESALSEYIANPAARLEKPAEISDVENTRNSAEKLKWETELAREQARERKRKNDVAEGSLMPQDQVHLALAGNAVALEAGIKHDVSVDVPQIMEQAESIIDKTERNTFIARQLHERIDRRMNEYANIKSFLAVIMEAEEVEETDEGVK